MSAGQAEWRGGMPRLCRRRDTPLRRSLAGGADQLLATAREAHEDLCRVEERNEGKFRDVKQFLREEVVRKCGNPTKEA